MLIPGVAKLCQVLWTAPIFGPASQFAFGVSARWQRDGVQRTWRRAVHGDDVCMAKL